jgi:hypothetical protein
MCDADDLNYFRRLKGDSQRGLTKRSQTKPFNHSRTQWITKEKNNALHFYHFFHRDFLS